MEHPNDKMPGSEMMIYRTEDGLTKIETTFDGDTVWLSADQMAELFQRDKSTISRHIKNIFSEGELVRDSVVAKFATTAADGKTYQVEYYNLDVIISVGYRVKSKRGTQFRIWATGILKEYMRKGFALDDERLKNLGGGGYFKELLERIRDIRASEKVFYRQVWKFTPPASTMTLMQRFLSSFSGKSRIRSTMPFMVKQRLRSFTREQMPKRNLWALPHLPENSPH